MFVFNKRPIRNKCLFWGLVLLIWAGAIAGTLWNKGYQPQSYRSFTDEEMVRISVQRALQRMQIKPPEFIRITGEAGQPLRGKRFQPAFIVPYRDVDHFMAENPDCCQISQVRKGVKLVWIEGKIFYKDKAGQTHVSKPEKLCGQYFLDDIRYLP
ncbi:hypothetical protein LJB99_06380 [Deltaproteobacteria bacterium OttesenSCG-928-K17]|nr:hypothetical protein [Deltaproteobacteria bacterium OttesenSCG-928-K17]